MIAKTDMKSSVQISELSSLTKNVNHINRLTLAEWYCLLTLYLIYEDNLSKDSKLCKSI